MTRYRVIKQHDGRKMWYYLEFRLFGMWIATFDSPYVTEEQVMNAYHERLKKSKTPTVLVDSGIPPEPSRKRY